MKLDQDLRLNLRYDFGKMNSTLGSVVPLAMFYIIFQTTPGPAPTHLAASTSSEKSSTRSSKVSRWSLQVWILLSLSLSFSLWLSTHTCLLSLFHFNLFQGGLCELQSIHTSWSWSRDGFQGERRIQPWDRVCKVLIFVNNWIHIANEDQWENLRSKLCLVLASKELAHRWFFKTIFTKFFFLELWETYTCFKLVQGCIFFRLLVYSYL